jgi:hypothetical protein
MGNMRILLALLGAALLLHCNRTTYTSENFPATDYLAFGKGGGFAGTSTTYYLLDNGQVFVQTGIGEAPKLPFVTLPRRAARQLLRDYDARLANQALTAPGNMTTFLRRVTADTAYVQMWGGADVVPDTVLTNFYKKLQATISIAQKIN